MQRPARASSASPLSPALEYALSTQGLTDGNVARLLPGGAQAFPEMLAAIFDAKREILLESYTIADDGTGRAFLDALEAAARRGVAVRLLCDGFGSIGLPSSRLAAVEAAGGHTVVYRPVAPWRRRWGFFKRDHRKLLIVDRTLGFVGGLNLADDYDERTPNGRYWRDLHLRLEGPAIAILGKLFAGTWNQHTDPGRRFRFEPTSPSVPAVAAGASTGVPVQIVSNRETRHRSLIRRSFLHAVRTARRSIWIANPYFIPDGVVARALTRAARHGIEVRVLVPARSDILMCDLAARATFGRLLHAGVRIAEWSLGMMHAKAAAIDGRWATVGSYNLDRRSLRYNLEVTANVYDERFAANLEQHLAADFARSTELYQKTFRARPLLQRVLSWIAYRFKTWL